MKRSSLLAAGAALAAGASAALLGAGYAIYRTWFHRTAQPEVLTTDEWERTVPYGAQMHADAAALAAAPYEPVQITADDGVPLAARCYHHADGAPVAIIFHGYKGFARRDGMGGYTLCKKLGYNVLLPDQRAHGASGGQSITLGVKERYDCRAALAKATVPVLLIHGEADSFVPCAMSRENFDACAAPKRLVTIPGAGHAVAYYVDIPGYERAVTDFMRGCLSKETKQGAAPPFFIFIFSFSKLPLGCTLPAMRVQ